MAVFTTQLQVKKLQDNQSGSKRSRAREYLLLQSGPEGVCYGIVCSASTFFR